MLSLKSQEKQTTTNQDFQQQILMAVQARPMNLLLPSPDHFITTTTNRDFIKPNQGFVDISNITTQMPTPTTMTGLWPYPPTGIMVKAHQESTHFPMYQSDLGSGKAESGLTSNNFTAPSRKRTRRSVYDQPPPPTGNLFDQQIINSHINHHHSEIDRFIAIHTEKVRMEMQERKKRQSRMLVTAIEERVVKKLREKDEEIERMGKLNWVLQERVKRLGLENQLWRDLAETNEATVNYLRNNLEQVLSLAGAGEERKAVAEEGEEEEEEAESCCGSNDYGRETKEESGGGGRCRKCGEAEARVLVLPCRHLCLCTMCGSTLHNCPVCNSAINASVHVNFS